MSRTLSNRIISRNRFFQFFFFFLFRALEPPLIEKRYLHVAKERKIDLQIFIFLGSDRPDLINSLLKSRRGYRSDLNIPAHENSQMERITDFSLRIGPPSQKTTDYYLPNERQSTRIWFRLEWNRVKARNDPLGSGCFILQPPVWINRSTESGGKHAYLD